MLLFVVIIMAAGAESAKNNLLITIQVKDERLIDVLQKVSNISGYEILFKGDGDFPVNAKVTNATVEEFLKKILRNVNYAAVWEENGKKISLSIYSGQGRSTASRIVPENRVRPPSQKLEMPEKRYPWMPPESDNGKSGGSEKVSDKATRPQPSISGANSLFEQSTRTTTQ